MSQSAEGAGQLGAAMLSGLGGSGDGYGDSFGGAGGGYRGPALPSSIVGSAYGGPAQPLGKDAGSGVRLSGGGQAPASSSATDQKPGARNEEDRPSQRQNCTFFMRTGTCAYGERCKFLHPADCPPPTLNSRGYPMRAGEPDCAHYIKKGWCAFGLTCKFNHPELAQQQLLPPTAFTIGGMLGGVQAQAATSSGAFLNLASQQSTAAAAAALGMQAHGLYAMHQPQTSMQPSAVYYLPQVIGGAGAAMAAFPAGAAATAAQQHQAAFAGGGLAYPAVAGTRQQAQMGAAGLGAAALMPGSGGMMDQGARGAASADQLTRAVQNLRLGGNTGNARPSFR